MVSIIAFTFSQNESEFNYAPMHISKIYRRCLFLGFINLVFFPAFAEPPPGVFKNKILIGESTDLTSSQSARPRGLLVGQKIFFDKINAEGGVHGRSIELIVYDDAYEPEKTLANTKTLVEKDKVFALFKYYGTPTIKAALAFIENEDIPLICPSSGADFLRTPPKKNIFVTKGGYFEVAHEMIDFLVDRKKLKKISLFYQDDSYGNDGRNGTNKALQGKNLEALSQGAYVRNTADVDAAFESIRKSKPEAILLWGLAKPSLKLIEKAKAEKLNTIFVGEATLANPEFFEGVKALKAEVYLVMGTPLLEDLSLKVTEQYVKDAKAKDIVPDVSGLEGYIDAMILVEGLKRAGPKLTREVLRTALEKKMTGANLMGLKIGFSAESHQALRRNFVVKIVDGNLVAVD